MKKPKKTKAEKREALRLEIAKQLQAFLAVRSKYPRDAEIFRQMVGDKEAEAYYGGMIAIEHVAQQNDFVIGYWYNNKTNEWEFSIVDELSFCG
ncbi:MAG: hypothetical protein IKC31_06305 [Clostridia bacterium]|nr:hypothetical protein [Clostridia bacterium]